MVAAVAECKSVRETLEWEPMSCQGFKGLLQGPTPTPGFRIKEHATVYTLLPNQLSATAEARGLGGRELISAPWLLNATAFL